MTRRLGFTLFTLLFLVSCAGRAWPASPLALAVFTENSVTVDLRLERDAKGQDFLSATFTPVDPALHLYSMDAPRAGVDGLGRPTLLELVPGSRIQAVGALSASVLPEPDEDGNGLLAYPAGAVTLHLPILLPEGTGWFDEQVSITYMACSGASCQPPVVGKLVTLHMPGRDLP
jgi:hypothetical protein